ncbi:hypothetical protein C6V83_07060 [Gordonia iterans]|uniref:AbiEi antitoxin C-terminal domain-containing protein n=1 Tax=Gordonia iterans TaxID=1004901 RepID=A0A2S0KEG1_9ACTN|nr:hypothetical protein [Gordonia iterans]AVM00065.1 hypothetical protein C6V83_07060 [Gordonia iterans]
MDLPLPRDLNGLVWRKDALDTGHTEKEIADLIKGRDLFRVCRGVYVEAARVPEDERFAELYRLRCLAAGTGPGSTWTLSHQSAAAVLGLELLKPDRSRVHVTNGVCQGGMRRRRRQVHAAPLNGSTVSVNGAHVTGVARTAVDVAAGGTFAQKLAVFDSALRAGCTRDELEAILKERRRVGAAAIRYALRMADKRAANPGESWSRAQMIEAGLPVPELQEHYILEDGRDAFVDCDWFKKLIGEFDGKRKYLRDRRAGETEADVVLREKEREDRLRDLGLDVVRWDFPDLERKRMVPRVAYHLRRNGLLA